MKEKTAEAVKQAEAAIEQLKKAGEDIFADQIAEIENKINEAKQEAAAEIEIVAEEVEEVKQNFIEKYGAGAARAVQIIILALILYKLF